MRYFIELSYNGKMYHGWQYQPNAISVQEVIEKALSRLLTEKISVMGCGRTDAGVHASQFFLHFETEQQFDAEFLTFKMNAYLPQDIALYQIFTVSDTAHARFSALHRSYEYRISIGKNPFFIDTAWQIMNKTYDVEKMNNAAKLLLVYKNFKCFSRSKTDVKTFDCTVTNAVWVKQGDILIFQITANRFLRNMVRAIVGTLLNVGLGKIDLDDFRKIIESKDRGQAGASVKAHGLFLTKIAYPDEVMTNYDIK